MGIFTNTASGNGKQRWTKEQDQLLIAMANEGKSRLDISKAVKHPENSITYRVRYLKSVEAKALADNKVVESTEDLLALVSY